MKSLELFAGIGGISLAAEWAGIETVAFCERDEFCQKVLKKHWPDVPIFDDVRTLNKQALEERGIDVGTIDIISGGFPCQPFSIAGKRKGTEDNRDLWPEMFRLIHEIRPSWVVGENVANFANMELERTLTDLESEGYKTQSFIIPSGAVEKPHRRERTFVVAYSSSFGCDNRGDHWEKRHIPKNKRITKKNKSEWYRWECRTSSFGEITLWRGTESPICRGNDGVSYRVDRIRSLGNAVVPQQIYPIFEAIRRSLY